MLRGRYGFRWMIAAWAALIAVALGVAFWLGPILAQIAWPG